MQQIVPIITVKMERKLNDLYDQYSLIKKQTQISHPMFQTQLDKESAFVIVLGSIIIFPSISISKTISSSLMMSKFHC